MGSSARKKAEKKKDFQKQRLKVGKQRPKATNATDTSFQSKAIVLREQSLAVTAPGILSQITHHLSLLSSRSDSQRRDALAFIANQLGSRSVQTPLPLSSRTLLSTLLPLTLDGCAPVRTNLLKALRALRADEFEGSGETILLHVRAGLTHMAAGIRETALNLTATALSAIPLEMVSTVGGWIKTLRFFSLLLGWPVAQGLESASTPKLNATSSAKLAVRGLEVLCQYLTAGLEREVRSDVLEQPHAFFPLSNAQLHGLSRTVKPFGHLGLFRSFENDDNETFQDRSERQASFGKILRPTFEMYLADLKKQGGDIGRTAALTHTAMIEGMADYEQVD